MHFKYISIFRSEKSPITAKRIQNIIDYLTFEVFKYAARGLYEKDKFLYTLLLALKIDLEKGVVKHEEFQSLIKGKCFIGWNMSTQKPTISEKTYLLFKNISDPIPLQISSIQNMNPTDLSSSFSWDTNYPALIWEIPLYPVFYYPVIM